METQLNKTDVFCLINKNYDAVYNLLKAQLAGEKELFFAERRQGAGYFLWRHPDSDWCSLSACDPEEKERILSEYETTRSRVLARLRENETLAPLADKVFSVPDESHIWYKDDFDGLCFLLSGWGYKYPLAASGGPIVEGTEEDVKQDVRVGFTYLGTLQPQMEFTIGPKASAANKKFTTDDSGMAHVGKLHPGVTYAVLFLPFGKTFPLTVLDGCDEYVFDVTRKAFLTVDATRDGEPLSGPNCVIQYAGQEYNLPFPEGGRITQSLVLQDEYRKASVNVEGEYQEVDLHEGANQVSFAFQSSVKEEPAEMPAYGTPVVKVVDPDGAPKAGYPVTVTAEGTINAYSTDEDGRFCLPVLSSGATFVVVDEKDKSHTKTYTVDDVNGEYVFVIPDGVPTGEKKWDCVLKLRNWTGFPIRQGAILYKQEGRPDILAQIDTKGRTYLCYEDFRIDDTITAYFQVPGVELDPTPFSLSKEHNKYVFRIRKMNFWIILLYILLGLLAMYLVYLLVWWAFLY